jgi:hypothetical protein
MIGLSELAATALVESMAESGVEAKKGMRLSIKDNQAILEIDSYSDNDHVILHQGSIALIIDKDLEAKIGDATIDIEDDPSEPYLAIRYTSSNNETQMNINRRVT